MIFFSAASVQFVVFVPFLRVFFSNWFATFYLFYLFTFSTYPLSVVLAGVLAERTSHLHL